MNKRGSALKTIVIIFSLLVLIALFSVIIYKIFKGGVEEEYDVSLKITKDSVNVTSNKVSLTISREKGDDIDLAQIKFVLFDGENLEEIILNASDLKQSNSKSFTFTSKNLSKITKISIIPIVKAKGENKSLKVSDSVKITYGKDNKIEVQQEKAFCGNKKKDTGEECDDGNLKPGDGCSTLCKLESCATQKGYLCASGKICPGTSLTSSNSGVCCNIPCVAEIKLKTIVCGDGVCNGNETYSTCSKDCIIGCGNNVCDLGETCSTCENDCGSCCGNSIINSGEQCDAGTNNGKNCTASYNQNCTYCSNTCQNTIVHGKYCGDGLCDSGETSGTCLVDCSISLKSLGTSCSSGSQCQSGFCVDNVCCNNACTGICKLCNLAENLGNCSNIPNNNPDPNNECSSITCPNYIYGWDGNSCKKYGGASGSNGMCNGAGACYTSVTDSCAGIGAISASCGSAGCKKICLVGGLATSYNSVSEVCYTSLQQSCQSNYFCDTTGTCVASLKANGQSCSAGSECSSGYCIEDICSSSATCNGFRNDGWCWYNAPNYGYNCNQVCAYHNAGVCLPNGPWDVGWNDDTSCTACKHFYPTASCLGQHYNAFEPYDWEGKEKNLCSYRSYHNTDMCTYAPGDRWIVICVCEK